MPSNEVDPPSWNPICHGWGASLHATLTVRMVLNRNRSIFVMKISEPLDVERKRRSEMNLAVWMIRGILPIEVDTHRLSPAPGVWGSEHKAQEAEHRIPIFIAQNLGNYDQNYPPPKSSFEETVRVAMILQVDRLRLPSCSCALN